jgi:hypothetical protein
MNMEAMQVMMMAREQANPCKAAISMYETEDSTRAGLHSTLNYYTNMLKIGKSAL